MVCTLLSTRCPVSAADSATFMVSASRISPIRMTSGLSRTTWRSAWLKSRVSLPTSRWVTMAARSSCTNSMGSSRVTMCRG